MDAADASPRTLRFNPFDPSFKTDPYATYAALRKADRPIRALGMLVLTRYDDVLAVLRERRCLSSLITRQIERQSGLLGVTAIERFLALANESIVFTDNPAHARLRRLIGKSFTPARLASFRDHLTVIADEILDEALDGEGDIDGAALAAEVPLRLMCARLGIPTEMRASLGQWTHRIRFLLEPGILRRSSFEVVKETLAVYETYLAELVSARRASLGGDLISELIAANDGGERLTDDEIIHACMMVFVAGNETTKALITNTLAALIDHPEQQDQLLADPALARKAVRETLRWDAPLQQTKRFSPINIEVGRLQIKANEPILLCLGAANRDPEVFERPDSYDVHRTGPPHLSLGFGMHACLGGQIAELEATAFIAALLARTGGLVAGRAPRQRQLSELIVRGFERLPLHAASAN